MRFPYLIAQLLVAGIALAAQDGTITGQYIEDRSARIYGCPCEWGNEWMNFGREAVMAWNIQSGQFQGQDLAGVRVVAAIAADFILTERGVPRHATLFLDGGARPEQRRAGANWIRSRFGALLGRIAGEHELPVEFRIQPDSISLKVGDVLTLSMRPTRLSQDTETWATLLYDPLIPLATSNLGTTTHIQYSGPDLKVNWIREQKAITGYYGTFALP